MSPCKGDTHIFVDNKGSTWEPALSMTLLVFIYVYRIDMNIERLVPCSNKHNLHLKNILSSNNKSKEKSTFRSKDQSMTSCCCKYIALGQSDLQLPIFKLFFVDAINWNLYIYFY